MHSSGTGSGAWITCLVYMSKSVTRLHAWGKCAEKYPLWCAQYATMNRTGYQEEPWTDTYGFGAWDKPLIYQYTSGGNLSGWSGRLDLDLAYMTPDEWTAMAKGETAGAAADIYPDKTDSDLAVEVMFGVHGSDERRKASLGARWASTQRIVETFYESITKYQIALVKYLKKFGTDKLI